MVWFLLTIGISTACNAQGLSAEQKKIAVIAYHEGAKYGYALETVAILWAESSLCADKRQRDPGSYGCGQFSPGTARRICKCKVSIKRLKTDSLFSITLTAKFISYCHKLFKDQSRAWLCYRDGEFSAAKASANKIRKESMKGGRIYIINSHIAELEKIPLDTN